MESELTPNKIKIEKVKKRKRNIQLHLNQDQNYSEIMMKHPYSSRDHQIPNIKQTYLSQSPFEIYTQSTTNKNSANKRNIAQVMTNRSSRHKLPQLVNHSVEYQQMPKLKETRTAKSRQNNSLIQSFNYPTIKQQNNDEEQRFNIRNNNENSRSIEPEPEDDSYNLNQLRSINVSLSKNYQPTGVSISSTHQQSQKNNISLSLAKKIRRDKDLELLQLHNRIKILQFEEERSLRKIDETRKKAQKLTKIQLGSEQEQKKLNLMKDKSRADLDNMIQDIKESVKKVSPSQSILKLQNARQQAVQELKQESKKNQREIEQQKMEFIYENMTKKQYVQQIIQNSQRNVETSRKRYIQEQLKCKEREALNEQKQIKKKANVIKKLSVVEQELMRKLKESHQYQKEALDELITGKYKEKYAQEVSISTETKQKSKFSTKKLKKDLQHQSLGYNFKSQNQSMISSNIEKIDLKKSMIDRYPMSDQNDGGNDQSNDDYLNQNADDNEKYDVFEVQVIDSV